MLFFLLCFLQSSFALEFDLEKAIQSPKDYGFRLEQPAIDFWAKRIPTYEAEPHPELGFSNVKSQSIRSIAVGKQRLIWDVTYVFDEHRRRVTWSKPLQKHEQAIIFSGCSFIFGTGLSGDETAPSQVARNLPAIKVYNAGIGASGTNQMVGLVRQKDFPQMYPEKRSLFVYVYIHDHVIRANALYPALAWMKTTPHFEEVDGRMVSYGSIEERKKWRTMFYEWAGSKFYEGSYFPELGDSHYQYVCDLVAEAKRLHEERGQGHKFVVVEHPMSPDEKFAACVKERGIPLLQYPYVLSPEDMIRGEGHPSAYFNQRWAKDLARDLAKHF